MRNQGYRIRLKAYQGLFSLWLMLFSTLTYASFIESTMGTAVVNDATATYYNPASLSLLKNSQIITLGSVGFSRSQFTGMYSQPSTGYTLSGSTTTNSHYFLPSFYLGVPTTNKVTLGFAIVANFFNSDLDDNSILRYVQPSNSIKAVDLVPAISFKYNEFLSLGAGVNISYANFLMEPTSGFPSLNIPDSQSRNTANGIGLGASAGLLFKASPTTFIGFNYRSSVTYRLSGKSVLEVNPEVVSDQYYFHFWTPARSVLSISHFITAKVGLIGTIQRIQWNIFRNINLHGIATQVGSQPFIVNATVPYHLQNTWLLTLGTQYRLTPKWIVRVAGSFNQSPGNSRYQIANGDSFILGASMGYEINKNIILDGSYAHAFIQNQDINIASNRSVLTGVNTGSRDGVSLKVTFNL